MAAPNETFILPVEKESRSEKALITPNQRRLLIECASDEFLNRRLDEAWTLPVQRKCDHFPGPGGHPKAPSNPASWQQELATFCSILTSFPVLCWLF